MPTSNGSQGRIPSSFTTHRAQLMFKRLSQELAAHAIEHQ
jgi:hypothetical protein